MQLPDPARIAHDMHVAVSNWHEVTARSEQKREGRLGISDIGNCREQARYVTVQQEPTDEPDKWTADIGSALDEYICRAIAHAYPDVRTGMEVWVTLPSGHRYPGHPDLVLPNGVLDVKTKFGLTQVRRQGPTERHQFQRHCYAGGLIQAGELPEDCFVGNVFFDRTGRDSVPHVDIEPYDPLWLHKADDWISDVTYAVMTGERAMQDRPIEWCRVACEFFTVCREPDLLSGDDGLIESIEDLDMIDAYLEAKEQIKSAERVVEDVRAHLTGISGSTGTHLVRWTQVGESQVPPFTRSPHWRLSIKPIREIER